MVSVYLMRKIPKTANNQFRFLISSQEKVTIIKENIFSNFIDVIGLQ